MATLAPTLLAGGVGRLDGRKGGGERVGGVTGRVRRTRHVLLVTQCLFSPDHGNLGVTRLTPVLCNSPCARRAAVLLLSLTSMNCRVCSTTSVMITLLTAFTAALLSPPMLLLDTNTAMQSNYEAVFTCSCK